ncbi:MAG: hypothetical protein ACXW2U_07120 [Telluria sp.]
MAAAKLVVVSQALAAALLFSAAAAASGPAEVPTMIVSVSAPELALHERAAASSKLKAIPKAAVKLPLDIVETDEDEKFYKVRIDGAAFWVKKAQVHVGHDVSTGCLAQGSAPIAAAGIRGAIRACK